MRRAACAWVIGFLLTSGVAVAAVTSSPPRASLTESVCVASSNPLDRAVGITAVIRPVAGTQRMELMFELQQRTPPSSSATLVQGGDLGRWRRSPATLGQHPSDVWQVQKSVANLPAPAFYRFRVAVRWRDASGHVLARAVHLGPSCYEPR
jgi:hypothetical protein